MLRRLTTLKNVTSTSSLSRRPIAGQKMWMSSTAEQSTTKAETYSIPVQFFHWTMGIFICTATGSVLYAQKTEDKQEKANAMFLHKSFGLMACILLVPRLASRFMTKSPGPIPGSSTLEALAGKVGHLAMYGLVIALPVSGVVMGSFSGFGLPFFYTTIPSVTKDPSIAKPAYEFHKIAGQIIEYMIPLHVASAFYHVVKGQVVFGRILGFLNKVSKTPKA